MSSRNPRVGDAVLYMTPNGLRPAVIAKQPMQTDMADVLVFRAAGDAPMPPFGGPEDDSLVRYHPGARRDGRTLYTWAYAREVL